VHLFALVNQFFIHKRNVLSYKEQQNILKVETKCFFLIPFKKNFKCQPMAFPYPTFISQ